MLTEFLISIPGWLRLSIAVLAAAAVVEFQRRSLRSFRRSQAAVGTPEQPRELIRGFRDGILSIGCLCAGVGVLLQSSAWVLFSLVFLFEEIVETGIMLLAGRGSRGRKV